MNTAAYVPIVVALVAVFRKWRPSLDGPLVLPVTLVCSALVVLGLEGAQPWPAAARSALALALEAVGVVTLADRHSSRIGAGLSDVLTNALGLPQVPPPPAVPALSVPAPASSPAPAEPAAEATAGETPTAPVPGSTRARD